MNDQDHDWEDRVQKLAKAVDNTIGATVGPLRGIHPEQLSRLREDVGRVISGCAWLAPRE